MGIGPTDRAIVEMWQRRMELEVALPIMLTFRNTHDYLKGRIEQVPEYGAVSRKHAVKRLAWLDRELDGREFVAGDRFTIADITLLIGVDFGRVSDIRIDSEHKNLTRWYGEVSSRPSAQA
jgi:glutathione S-transferase